MTTSTITPAQFRTDFPEFASVTAYPDSGINFYLTLAANSLRLDVYGPTLDAATELFVAHNLVLEAQALAAGAAGGAPVGPPGPVSSRAVGPVSKSYDTTIAAEDQGGYWNLTVYGLRFLRLGKVRAVRPLQVGPGGCGYAQAWPGPFQARFLWGAG